MTPFAEALEEAAERLARKQQEVVDKLINLEDHLGRRLLDSTTLGGREPRAQGDGAGRVRDIVGSV